MSERQLDCLFIEPDVGQRNYQDLSKDWMCRETPTWSMLLAQACRTVGYGVAILDCNAERLSDADAVKRIAEISPRLICFVVYGGNPNSGTTNMVGAVSLAEAYKQIYPKSKICIVGSHASALPLEVMKHDCFDFCLLNEGSYALKNLLATNLGRDEVRYVKGIGWKPYDKSYALLNDPVPPVPTAKMDHDLPGYAWDLLPYKDKPFDLYRSHSWHANFDHSLRTPCAAIYTTLGCPMKCAFCMINILNRVDNADGIDASHSSGMRYWSTNMIMSQIDYLASQGVRTIRFSDELFFFNKQHFEPLLNAIASRDYAPELRIWSYSRVDTIRDKYLELFRKAGITWLALGIETGNQQVRREVTKGTYEETDIHSVIKQIDDAGINTIANYIYGLPTDTYQTMQETLDLAIQLNTPMYNAYSCAALPGSPLYTDAKKRGVALPDSYSGYSFLGYETLPLPTETLTAAEVLKFRDEAFYKYFDRPAYLDMIEKKFGLTQRQNILELLKVRLRRKILGD